jgi:hypothetical protein
VASTSNLFITLYEFCLSTHAAGPMLTLPTALLCARAVVWEDELDVGDGTMCCEHDLALGGL